MRTSACPLLSWHPGKHFAALSCPCILQDAAADAADHDVAAAGEEFDAASTAPGVETGKEQSGMFMSISSSICMCKPVGVHH
jgi:hypothetical protein